MEASARPNLGVSDGPNSITLCIKVSHMMTATAYTLMIQQILGKPDWQNRLEIEDLRALSPLIYAHVNPYGRFELNMSTRLRLD